MARERILVIEDEEDILEVIMYNLAKNGFQVTCVTSGEKALAEIESHLPDVVVIDISIHACTYVYTHVHAQLAEVVVIDARIQLWPA